MRGVLAAIDLETTGLDASTDSIIEIGVVRMENGVILDEFETLIDPDIPIPERTTLITGIRQEDIVGAPSIKTVLPKLVEFVGDAPIIGHSVGFDLGFMRRHGIFQNNLALDTYDLAAVLMPRVPRYNLHNLTSTLGIELEDAHRALDDARAAGVLYWALYEKALQLPYAVVEAIAEAARGLDWYAAPAFEAALQEKEPDDQLDSASQVPFQPLETDIPPLEQNQQPEALPEADVRDVLQTGGPLSEKLPNYEHRVQQETMAVAVAEAFNDSQHLLIEAGTGTGKSMAYLIPAMLWAAKNNERVVISTDTIHLQDQLLHKDIPLLQDALSLDTPATVVKGRGNYLCPRRYKTIIRRKPTNVDELRTLAKIMVWLLESDSGDKGEISLRGWAENGVWRRLSAQDEGCTLNRCESIGRICPFYKARKRAEAANLLVVNHALLISDAETNNRVLPEYTYLVLDEAHHLEDAITQSLSYTIDEPAMMRRLGDLGGPKSGLLADLVQSLQTSDVPERNTQRIVQFINDVFETNQSMRVHIQNLFKVLHIFGNDVGNVRAGDFVSRIRIQADEREANSFGKVQSVWKVVGDFLLGVTEAIQNLAKTMPKMRKYRIDRYEELLSSIEAAAEYLAETHKRLADFIEAPDENAIYWLSIGSDGSQVSLHVAPLHIGSYIEEQLWQRRRSVVMTSATLRTNGSFDHIQRRIMAESVNTLEVGSPFDYQNAALVYLPKDIAEPNDFAKYQHAVETTIVELAAALEGRVLALFTSYTQLRQTARNITPRLALGNITVYDQSDGTSRQALLEGFKTTERAVLLGTRSFWEGIDVPGESLSALVIARLPFPVPSDPIISARSDTYTNSFNDYTIPEAILRFRQGFGRLIRTRTDRGVVVILDRRIKSKRYGTQFLDALPNCTIQEGRLSDLPQATTAWLNQ